MASKAGAVLHLFYYLTSTAGKSVRREPEQSAAAALQEVHVDSIASLSLRKGGVLWRDEEAFPVFAMGKNDTTSLLEDNVSPLSDTDKSIGVSGDPVGCILTMDNVVDSATYGGHNLEIQGDKTRWESAKKISFRLISEAYLVICGRNLEGNSCASGGFSIHCERVVPSNRGDWQAIGDNSRRKGEGDGWHAPCASGSGFHLPGQPHAEKMWASSANPACFRWRTPVIDCVMHDWGTWGKCSKECGSGNQARTRGVKQKAKWGGKACPLSREERTCNTQLCAVDCKMNEWDTWGTCSKSCGTGEKVRTRGVKQNAKGGGKACPDARDETSCNTNPCPVDCEVNEWEDWGDCSKLCGGGEMKHTRTVKTEAQHGGNACPSLANTTDCNTEACSRADGRGGVALSEMVLIYLVVLLCRL
eukprot:TRINITY_DN25197_c1_g1_i1.p1 TRINITY_DN25197_c1_g1~~TRINITY_DN25197_c1_g1_i1.p1  ORF type:complete len:417 (+),score=56.90 TRINITY_DN25197_c1_g1_i1:59-1309(+)